MIATKMSLRERAGREAITRTVAARDSDGLIRVVFEDIEENGVWYRITRRVLQRDSERLIVRSSESVDYLN
jgi:hypothetical protein